MMNASEQLRLLAKICRMYYLEDMTQLEIARAIGISRSKVSRSLSQAREEGVVKISIIDAYSEEQQCENELRRRFGLDDASVVAVSGSEQMEIDRQMAAAISVILEATLRDGDVIGVMAGYAVNGISEHIGYVRREGLRIVPLVGGLGSSGAKWQSDQTAQNFAERLRCPYLKLNAPACVLSKEAHDALIREPEIRGVLELAESSAIAFVGIGQFSDSATILQAGALHPRDVAELSEKGAVASICGSFLDDQGQSVSASVSERMISVDLNGLRQIPKVIAVANGQKKVRAITAALRSGVLNVLVTDLDTAKAILAFAG